VSVSKAKTAYKKALKLDSISSDVLKLSGILSFLDWQWEGSKVAFQKAIQKNPNNMSARHWYSLWLSAMGHFDEALAQSDTISSMDSAGDYLVGRASLLYFQYRFEEMKPLMMKNIEQNPEIPWGYDWLGMAYNGLDEHEDAIKTYFKAFELSDGTVEVGAGLGHALGHAGETELAKQMAEYYALAAKDNYLPPVQRSFIHLGIGEYEEAINLLEQAYTEQSWFLIFIQIEHWYDPIRKDIRFIDIMNKMGFPN
jgi:tetratricopeptide (TPR) repeat protein